jgi:transforming growth factor-beta-induced protein
MIATLFTRRALTATSLTLALFGTTACGSKSKSTTEPAPVTITQTAAKTATLSTLTSALTQAGLAATLDGAGPFTVFAPVNGAFTALPAGVVTNLLASGNAAILTKLLGYHVVSGRFPAASLTNGQVLTTVEGTQLTVSIASGVVKVGGATVTTPDISASNGVVHLIDGVLLGSLDIVDQATIRGFSSLVSSVSTAGLVTALRGGGPTGLTVFAPTNAAFAAIPGGAPTNATTLASVLKLHVIGARALSNTLTNGQKLTTLQGPQLTVGISGSTITVAGPSNNATVGPADIVTKNGVIHVIDKVLLP